MYIQRNTPVLLLLRELVSRKHFLLATCTVVFLSTHLFGTREQVKSLNGDNHLSLWLPYDPNSCNGNFSAPLSYQLDLDSAPILIREASVDNRFVSIQNSKKKNPNGQFLRLQILMTVVPDPKKQMQREIEAVAYNLTKKSSLHYSNGSIVKEINLKYDYLIEDGRCQRSCNKYRTCRVREWQAILTLRADDGISGDKFQKSIDSLIDSHAFLRFTVPVILRDSSLTEILSFELSLGCFAGLSSKNQLPIQKHITNCQKSEGAVTIAGSPPFGKIRNNPLYWKKIAHYAARHLYGHTWYDTVAVPILPVHTISYIQHMCELDTKCRLKFHNENLKYMERIRSVVEVELTELQVPAQEWSRLVLFQFCGLGSDFRNTEADEPCASSFHGGQKILGLIGYTHFGPYHAWASNFDIDEFLVDEMAVSSRSETGWNKLQSGSDRFNKLRKETNKSTFYATWLDFKVEEEDMNSFTSSVMKGERIAFKPSDPFVLSLNLTECYDGGGKVITHCSKTAGMLVHYALRVQKISQMNETECGPLRTDRRTRLFRTSMNETELYTWHVRESPRQGKCVYDSRPLKDKNHCRVRPHGSIDCNPAIHELPWKRYPV